MREGRTEQEKKGENLEEGIPERREELKEMKATMGERNACYVS